MESIRKVSELGKNLGMKMAVVQVKRGESTKEAWHRHLKENPSDALAIIKIFNQPMPG
jgi:hypothetical protein